MSPIVLNVLIGLISGVIANLMTGNLSKMGRSKPAADLWDLTFLLTGLDIWGRRILIIAFPVTTLALIEYRWALSYEHALLLVSGMLVVGILVSLGIDWVTKKLDTKKKLMVTPFFGFVFGFFLFYFMDWHIPNYISIKVPNHLESTITLSGRVTDKSLKVYLILDPLDGGDFVFPAKTSDKGKNWYVTCSIGGGPGAQFYLKAVALPSEQVPPSELTPEPEWLESHATCRTKRYKRSVK